MQTMTQQCDITSRHDELADELSAGCDSDFDTPYEELDREFQELRIALRQN